MPAQLESFRWFHALSFPDGTTSAGRFPGGTPQNYTLYGGLALLDHIELRQARCMDIGTMDGLMAFSLKQAGAREVIATDVASRPSFLHAREKLGLAVEYRVPFLVSELSTAPDYDLIAYAGVLYHVFDPLVSLVRLRRALRARGLLILETQYLFAEPGARLSFVPAQRWGGSKHPNTFFRPSLRALRAMAEIAGFEVVTTLATLNRLTLLLRAARPSEIAGSTPMVRTVLDRYRHYSNYKEEIDHKALESAPSQAEISYAGPRGDFYLGSSRFRTSNPLQSPWRPPLLDRTKWVLADAGAQLLSAIARRKHLPSWRGTA